MAEELPVDLRTRRGGPRTPPDPPPAPKSPPRPPPEASLPLRKRRSAMRGFGGAGGSGDPPPKPPNSWAPPRGKPPNSAAPPAFCTVPGLPLPLLGGGAALGAVLGVAPPPPDFGTPSFKLGGGAPPPPEPPLAAAIAAATRQDEDGDTPLHIAVAQGALPVARRLVALFLRGGRELDVYNHLRQTPLHLAVITGQVALVRLLVAHGASPMAPDRLGRTCAHLACGSHLPGGGAGGGATAGPRPRVLRELLRTPGPPPDLQARDYEGLTPLHVAVGSGSRESVLVLLEHGADVDAVDIKSGRSPLLHAVENNSLEMAELLLQRGASVNAQSYAGCTALHAAAGRGLLGLLRLLLRCGADCGVRNLHNDTPAGVAASAQVIDILRGKASRPPQNPPSPSRDPPDGLASEPPPTSGSAANGAQGAGLPQGPLPLVGAQRGPAPRQSRDQSEAALGRPRPVAPQRLRPREGRGQGSINGAPPGGAKAGPA
ncbi:LOW QUALITY PROTEIN: B-cell lymphoma 3 protein-like [Aphelocoma coerulescens]|uniref:LOW QUALITY PROTEIN: B-cell lymphoma 3 protein-like n=1 Tax=Aphelocoma coerulescens TaxID=39617 RepID=UPI00360437BE